MTKMMMVPVILVMGLSLALTAMLTQKKENKETWAPFECGFKNMMTKRNPFSLQFFLIALAFLVFDVEILLLLPYPTSTPSHKQNTEMMILLWILTLGLAYEMKTKKLEWNK